VPRRAMIEQQSDCNASADAAHLTGASVPG
jgi:hypothetical protein